MLGYTLVGTIGRADWTCNAHLTPHIGSCNSRHMVLMRNRAIFKDGKGRGNPTGITDYMLLSIATDEIGRLRCPLIIF